MWYIKMIASEVIGDREMVVLGQQCISIAITVYHEGTVYQFFHNFGVAKVFLTMTKTKPKIT